MNNRFATRGRPVTDTAWHSIVDKAERTLPKDGSFNENENMVQEWQLGHSWHGCAIHPRYRDRATESVWVCKFYLAGQQRVLGRGTLYQCARLYDAALVHYAKYRTGKPTNFNFDERQAGNDQMDADFVLYFGAIEDYFNEHHVILTTSEQRVEHSRLATLDRQHDTRTASGRIEVRLTAIESDIKKILETQGALDLRLNTLSTQLALVLNRFHAGLMPEVNSASPELLVDAKNNLTAL
jgi:hypothetical protein